MTQPLYPLRFKEILRNYGFGNRWIVEAYDKVDLPTDHRVAETWEVCDRPGESSTATNGPLTGKTLHEMIGMYGEALLGTDVVARGGTRFPLLIKFLDASNPLGEQVHQSDEMAAQRGLQDPGKTEAWFMLKARDGAVVHAGNVDDITPDDVRRAILAGTVRELMKVYEVRPGDAFLLYAGTMHYSPGGVLFYEIMQNSDVGMSLRPPDPRLSQDEREARVRAAAEGVLLEDGFDAKTTPVQMPGGANARTFIFACRYFVLEHLGLYAPTMMNCDGSRFYVLSLIDGACTVVYGEQREHLLPGHTVLLPASLGYVTLIPTKPSALLKAYVPNLVKNVIEPLRLAGVPDDAIRSLGGRTRRNDLAALL
jgi:mannose-6-phosphate isomerase